MGACTCYCLEKTYPFLQALGEIPLDTLTDSPAYLLGLRNRPPQACSVLHKIYFTHGSWS